MMVRNLALRSAVAISFALWASPQVFAADSGAYVGLSYGQSKSDITEDDSGFFNVLASTTTDNSDTAWALAFGYRFNPGVAIELAYNDLGESTFSESGTDTTFPAITGTLSGSASVKGPSVALIGAIPISNWELFGKLGVLAAKTEIEARFTGRTLTSPVQSFNISERLSASTVEVLVGLGVGYTIAEHYHLKFEWTKVPNVGDEEETGESDVSVLALGFQYRF